MSRSIDSFGSSKPSVGREKAPQLNEQVDLLEWPKKGNSVTVRLLGPVAPRGVHKIKVTKRTGEETEITKACLAFDPSIDDKDSDKHCPYCEMDKSMQRYSKVYFINVIDRRLTEDAPAKIRKTAEEQKTGHKDMDSNSWTPVRVLRVPSTLALRFKTLGERNVVKTKDGEKKAFPATHPRFGFDIDVSFDKSLPAANMYSADRNTEEKYTPLTEEEKAYLTYDLEPLYEPEDEAVAESEAESLSSRWGDSHPDEKSKRKAKDEEDDDIPRSKSKKNAKSKVDDYDDEDDEPPRKKKAKSKNEDDDLDLDDDEDDEEPVRKKKPVAKSKKKVDDDEDDDLDLDDDDEDDEEPVRKKKPVSKSKKRTVDEDDDDDLDLDDDDEEDEPPKKKASTKSKKKVVEEDDDLDLDDDEDDEEPVRKKKPASKSEKKAEDFDDDIPY